MSEMKLHELVGYFDSPEQTEPAHDPGLEVPCVVCWEPLAAPMVTLSLMWADRSGDKSLFYRAHKDCWSTLDEDEQERYDRSILEAIRDA
jgi:hypothetical protein